MVDRGGDPWKFSTKGNLGSSEVFIGRCGVRHSPNIPNIARKLIKRRQYSKRNGHGSFCEIFISDSILLLLVAGQIFKRPFPFPQKVSRHISARKQFTSSEIAI